MENKLSFNELINQPTPVLVDFYADWCGPCKAMAPVLKQFAAEMDGKVRVVKIDVDRNQAVAQHYRIMGVPTFMLFKNGEAVWQQSGMLPISHLRQVVSPHIAETDEAVHQ
jgi:thioredoxin 1